MPFHIEPFVSTDFLTIHTQRGSLTDDLERAHREIFSNQ